ncbi:MAG: class I SAM-dependent methyltransferase [Rickettsiaceae bacterium]|nr:class I SAM-dependent methyltransferase [Rickettsiaceae bacterium]
MPIDAKIRKIIETNGYINIDDMMEQVLLINPDSYYVYTENIGIDGDFITSPEISQLFGEIIALWVIEQWQKLGKPNEFCLLELGPGQGTLMDDLLRTSSKIASSFLNGAKVHLLEINHKFIQKQKFKLEKHKKEITWVKKILDLPELPLIVISNEFFDALPIKQFVKTQSRWHESILIIDPIDGKIKYSKIEIKQALQNQLKLEHLNANDGAVIEESIESLEIIRALSDHINKYSGAVLIIDYGYDIQTSERTRNQYNSTLQAVKNHQYWPIIDTLGEADLTAHVDFNALKRASKERGVSNFRNFSQRNFLLSYGIELRLHELKKTIAPEECYILDRQVLRLISPSMMGELFKVLEISNHTNFKG